VKNSLKISGSYSVFVVCECMYVMQEDNCEIKFQVNLLMG